MTTQEILDEIRSRSGDDTLADDVLLTKANNEYDQTNLEIINLNEDYFYEDSTLAVTSSVGPYSFPAAFAKLRGLWRPSESLVEQRSPLDKKREYGWFLAGTTSAGVKQFKFTDTPDETGNYTIGCVVFPSHLDTTTPNNPLWPAPFHEILILGALKRLFSVEDIYEKFPELRDELRELKASLLAQVGGLNLGANRQVRTQEGDLD